MKKTKILAVSLLAAATALGGAIFVGCSDKTVTPNADICTLDIQSTDNADDRPTYEITASKIKGIQFAWSIVWSNPDEVKTLSDYISFNENGYTATIKASNEFDGQAILSATWGKGDNAYTATKSIGYSEKFTYSLSGNKEYSLITGCELEIISDLYAYAPKTFEGKPVKEIGEYAFKDNTVLTKITIPNNIVKIGSGAFAGCTALTSITIPDSVTYIGYDTFKDCTALTSITIPDSVTYMGYETFKGCTSLVNVSLTKNITNISGYMFSECTSLASITIPAKVKTIYDKAFFKCSSLTDVKFLGNKSKITIYPSAFSSCPYNP